MASAEVWITLPKTTCCTSSGWIFAWASAAFALSTARSVAVRSFSAPPKVPKAVRFADRIQTSSCFETLFMSWLLPALSEDQPQNHAQCPHGPQQARDILLPDLLSAGACQPRLRSFEPRGGIHPRI